MSKVIAPFGFNGRALVAGLTLDFDASVAIADVSATDARRLRAQGFTVVEYEPESAPATVALPPGETLDTPAKSDTKAEWVDYGVSQGHARGSLEELTKAEIQSVLEG